MAIAHDAPECIVGDITPADGVPPETKHVREQLAADFLACLLRDVDESDTPDQIYALWQEYEAGESSVAQIVHQIDWVEAVVQASIYHRRYPHLNLDDFKTKQGVTDPWLSRIADEALASWDATAETRPIVFLIGPPGVGKGTQGALVSMNHNLAHVSVGELLRQEQRNPKSKFSSFISRSFQHSVPVPAILSIILLKNELGRNRSAAGFLLDGFPRSAEQLAAFEEQISRNYATISMECTEQVLIDRLTKRSASSGRDDDKPEAIQQRITAFKSSNEGLEKLLSKAPLRKVDCAGSIDEIRLSFRSAMQDLSKQSRPT
ncbi:hypothetical protein MCOR24_010562 [Pyricularia oryzae]|nr:hypothetical protein MCOR24_010562 [Pyricularia oryzae]